MHSKPDGKDPLAQRINITAVDRTYSSPILNPVLYSLISKRFRKKLTDQQNSMATEYSAGSPITNPRDVIEMILLLKWFWTCSISYGKKFIRKFCLNWNKICNFYQNDWYRKMIFYFHTERIIMIQPWTRNIPMERNKIIFWSFLDCSIEKIILISLDGSGFVSFKYNLKILSKIGKFLFSDVTSSSKSPKSSLSWLISGRTGLRTGVGTLCDPPILLPIFVEIFDDVFELNRSTSPSISSGIPVCCS